MRLLNVNLSERTLGSGKILFHHVKDLGLLDTLHAKYGYDFIGPYNRRREITDRRDKNLDGREGDILPEQRVKQAIRNAVYFSVVGRCRLMSL